MSVIVNDVRVVGNPKGFVGFVGSVGAWWANVERLRGQGGMPDWCFDFVSIHSSRFSSQKPYTMMGPSKLTDANSKRPHWETVAYGSKAEAMAAAKRVARRLGLLGVVDCCHE